MIKLTVALPLFRAKNIAWLAMESLCRQENIDFEWELIVAEETEKYNNLFFGKDNLYLYESRLKEVGCSKILYVPLDKWISLSKKWIVIARRSEDSSKMFLLQAADCYSNPNRLRRTYNIHCKTNADWIQTNKHVLYNLKNDKVAIYIQKINNSMSAADMAVRTSLINKIKPINIDRKIDTWLLKSCKSKKRNFIIKHDNSKIWKNGINVTGINNISNRDKIFSNSKYLSNLKLENIVPGDIAEKLRKCKKDIIDIKRWSNK